MITHSNAEKQESLNENKIQLLQTREKKVISWVCSGTEIHFCTASHFSFAKIFKIKTYHFAVQLSSQDVISI